MNLPHISVTNKLAVYFIHSALPPGSTPTTISDFWQMIWDHKPAVIVMLTRVQENGKVSMLYWPGDMDQCLLMYSVHCVQLNNDVSYLHHM